MRALADIELAPSDRMPPAPCYLSIVTSLVHLATGIAMILIATAYLAASA